VSEQEAVEGWGGAEEQSSAAPPHGAGMTPHAEASPQQQDAYENDEFVIEAEEGTEAAERDGAKEGKG
jgi:hypothetical protein